MREAESKFTPEMDAGGIICRDRESTMVFYGGFDPANISLDPAQEAAMLALTYPAADSESLRLRVGSIDYSPNPQNEKL